MGRAYERDLELENLNQGPPPERFYTCDQCGGEGAIYSAGWSYAPGCGYPHEDVEVHTCSACNGSGGWIDEAESDRKPIICTCKGNNDCDGSCQCPPD